MLWKQQTSILGKITRGRQQSRSHRSPSPEAWSSQPPCYWQERKGLTNRSQALLDKIEVLRSGLTD
jgi:hypothetical protein